MQDRAANLELWLLEAGGAMGAEAGQSQSRRSTGTQIASPGPGKASDVRPARDPLPESKAATNRAIEGALKSLSAQHADCPCYPFLAAQSLTASVVDDVFSDLRSRFGSGGNRLLVVVDSGGGDIHAAFNLASLFRRYGRQELTFIVPRWAKSAATLLVCAGDRVLMSPVAELGPLDPQITTVSPLENRVEQFSPLHIDATLELIRNEYKNGSRELAESLVGRLQWPLTLGSFRKSLEIGRTYVHRLLTTRMLKGNETRAAEIAERLATGYADHSYVLNLPEVAELGLVAEELTDAELDVAWRIHDLDVHLRELTRRDKQRENERKLREISPNPLEAGAPPARES